MKKIKIKFGIVGICFLIANPGVFFVYFRSFQTTNSIFTTNQCEKMSCPSSIRHRDSNPRPLEHDYNFNVTHQMPNLHVETRWENCEEKIGKKYLTKLKICLRIFARKSQDWTSKRLQTQKKKRERETMGVCMYVCVWEREKERGWE